jgi:hypothetical protein
MTNARSVRICSIHDADDRSDDRWRVSLPILQFQLRPGSAVTRWCSGSIRSSGGNPNMSPVVPGLKLVKEFYVVPSSNLGLVLFAPVKVTQITILIQRSLRSGIIVFFKDLDPSPLSPAVRFPLSNLGFEDRPCKTSRLGQIILRSSENTIAYQLPS